MGLFFNFEKAGPGIDKDAPKKKGIFLYTELFFRKFWLLIKANLLYFAVSLPVIALYNAIIINAVGMFLPEATGTFRLSVVITAIITILWGTGPVTGGYVYLLRNFAREEHVWLTSDFFQQSREAFKTGITVLILDIAVMIFGTYTANVYVVMIQNGSTLAKIAMAVMLLTLMLYTFMHYYVYEFCVTFEDKTHKNIINAFMTGMATFSANLFLTVFIILLTMAAFYRLMPLAIILLSFVCWISFMRFPIDFYAARMIKRKFIDTQNIGKKDE